VSQALSRHFNTNAVSTSLRKNGKVDIKVNEQPYFVDKKDRKKVIKFIYDFDNLEFDNATPPKPITFELNQ
jgi:hypothetical protein